MNTEPTPRVRPRQGDFFWLRKCDPSELSTGLLEAPQRTSSFTLPGIGKLVISKRKARMGRNPATGEAIKIPAKTVVKMRVAKAAKEAIVPKKK